MTLTARWTIECDRCGKTRRSKKGVLTSETGFLDAAAADGWVLMDESNPTADVCPRCATREVER